MTMSQRKDACVLLPPALLDVARRSARAEIREAIVDDARPWREMSDETLWLLMFAHTITRSGMVLSNGSCPACDRPVVMYQWLMDALEKPWKTQCPRCSTIFPTNDFEAFYKTGLDEQGIFRPERADRSLLFNAQHSDPSDPLHRFGVDDGEGYVAGDRRWRFIGAYLIRGHWRQVVMPGVCRLAEAHVVTGEAIYARKAAILLDRIADLYPMFDGDSQILYYEKLHSPGSGYVSTWHDACEDTRMLAIAYDRIRAAASGDAELVAFLSDKATAYKLDNPKSSWADIRRNIEERILRDALAHPKKIYSNYPRTPICAAIIQTVLDSPDNREQVMARVDEVVRKCTAFDGVTGERGLAAYAAHAIRSLAEFLATYARADPPILDELLSRHPALRQAWRFHIDTHCLGLYYPRIGDSGHLGSTEQEYVGVRFADTPGSPGDDRLAPSMYSFLWRLYQVTGDPAYAQVMHRANGATSERLPHDLFEPDPDTVRAGVDAVIREHGDRILLASVNKPNWGLAILRSGDDEHGRALSLFYGAGGMHCHHDSMTIGLYAMGTDLMADFGYPPVQYGGWGSPSVKWYRHALAHNTVAVDRQSAVVCRNVKIADDTENLWTPGMAVGTTTLWAPGRTAQAVAVASAPTQPPATHCDRVVAMVDVDAGSFYVMDVIHVAGGGQHDRITQSGFAAMTIEGASPAPSEELGYPDQTRDFCLDPSPSPGWSVRWTIHDRTGMPLGSCPPVLRMIDLTHEAEVLRHECWVDASDASFSDQRPMWIPRVSTRRRAAGDQPLSSTFVSLLEANAGRDVIQHARRLDLAKDVHVGIEVHTSAGIDVMLYIDPLHRRPEEIHACRTHDIELDGRWCWLRMNASGELCRLTVAQSSMLRVGPWMFRFAPWGTAASAGVIEMTVDGGQIHVPENDRKLLVDATCSGVPCAIVSV